MKIGILGCGYVGKALALHLKRSGYQISVTTRQSNRLAELSTVADEVHLIQDKQGYEDFLKELAILIIAVAPNSSANYYATYFETAQHVTHLLGKSSNSSLKQIIYTSSTSVYGDHQGEWVDETTPCKPLNENGRILIETENQLLSAMTDQLNISIFRLGEIIGPNRLIQDRLNSPIKIFPGDGQQYTNLTHLNDIVQATDLAIQKRLRGVYNLCNDFHESRKTLYDKLCQKFNLSKVEWDKELKSPHGGNKRISSQKIKNLGLKFQECQFEK